MSNQEEFQEALDRMSLVKADQKVNQKPDQKGSNFKSFNTKRFVSAIILSSIFLIWLFTFAQDFDADPRTSIKMKLVLVLAFYACLTALSAFAFAFDILRRRKPGLSPILAGAFCGLVLTIALTFFVRNLA